MTVPGTAARRLRTVPRPQRRDALVALVVAEFKASLLMDDEDRLALDENYFELGMTSLSLVELRERLAETLGRDVDVTLMFNHPTVEHLITHLTEDILADLFPTGGAPMPAPPPAPSAGPSAAAPAVAEHRRSLVNQLLTRLYQSPTGPEQEDAGG